MDDYLVLMREEGHRVEERYQLLTDLLGTTGYLSLPDAARSVLCMQIGALETYQDLIDFYIKTMEDEQNG